MLGQWQDYAFAVFILLFTSLGVGFDSLISETDTQAVQYSMLLLLASIFLVDFFGPALDAGTNHRSCMVVTATYGIRMLQRTLCYEDLSACGISGNCNHRSSALLIDWIS